MLTRPTPGLDYATPPHPIWRRLRRCALLVVMLMITAGGVVKRGEIATLLNRAWLLHWQQRCLSYDLPGGRRVVLDRGCQPEPSTPPARCWRMLNAGLGPGGRGSRNTARGDAAGTLLFLGPLDNTAGERRLVVLELVDRPPVRGGGGRGGAGGPRIIMHVVEPGSWRADPVRLQQDRMDLGTLLRGANAGTLRVGAGRIDPAEPTRFTLAYEVGGRTGILDGSLCGDELFVFARDAADGLRQRRSGR